MLLPAEPSHQLGFAVFKNSYYFKMDKAASGGCGLLDDGLQGTLELITVGKIVLRYNVLLPFLFQNFLYTLYLILYQEKFGNLILQG